ncbi:MAG: winged helix-turn-helix transcriptional regulator [Proteobacteria bacterium]|nr:winged helix-turn-helix transcriptional regulator [Pseudomonadota bacterium]
MPAKTVSANIRDGEDGTTPDRSATDHIAALAKALAHPARIKIVRILARRQTCIGCDIVEEIGLAQSTTSEHLRIMKTAGIITGEIERPRVCYSLDPAALEPLRHFLGEVSSARAGAKKD